MGVAVTLKPKLGLERPPYRILGLCNQRMAARALAGDKWMGLLLPCNVAICAAGDCTVVAVTDPGVMSRLSSGPEGAGVAAEARARLTRVIERLASESA